MDEDTLFSYGLPLKKEKNNLFHIKEGERLAKQQHQENHPYEQYDHEQDLQYVSGYRQISMITMLNSSFSSIVGEQGLLPRVAQEHRLECAYSLKQFQSKMNSMVFDRYFDIDQKNDQGQRVQLSHRVRQLEQKRFFPREMNSDYCTTQLQKLAYQVKARRVFYERQAKLVLSEFKINATYTYEQQMHRHQLGQPHACLEALSDDTSHQILFSWMVLLLKAVVHQYKLEVNPQSKQRVYQLTKQRGYHLDYSKLKDANRKHAVRLLLEVLDSAQSNYIIFTRQQHVPADVMAEQQEQTRKYISSQCSSLLSIRDKISYLLHPPCWEDFKQCCFMQGDAVDESKEGDVGLSSLKKDSFRTGNSAHILPQQEKIMEVQSSVLDWTHFLDRYGDREEQPFSQRRRLDSGAMVQYFPWFQERDFTLGNVMERLISVPRHRFLRESWRLLSKEYFFCSGYTPHSPHLQSAQVQHGSAQYQYEQQWLQYMNAEEFAGLESTALVVHLLNGEKYGLDVSCPQMQAVDAEYYRVNEITSSNVDVNKLTRRITKDAPSILTSYLQRFQRNSRSLTDHCTQGQHYVSAQQQDQYRKDLQVILKRLNAQLRADQQGKRQRKSVNTSFIVQYK